MDADRWRLVKDLFQGAIALHTDERLAFLTAACAGDETLRWQVGLLLQAHEEAGDFFDQPPRISPGDELSHTAASAPWFAAAAAEFLGTDRFTVRRRLGAGGMGIVYQVHDRTRDEDVALKTLRRATATDIYQLKREFRGLTDLAHPNVVCLHELFVDEDTCFFTMELVDGVSVVDYVHGGPSGLAQQARSADRMDRARRAVRQLVTALLHLHARGKLHRDVKPSNVLVTPAGRVVVLDFGLIVDTRAEAEGHGDDRAAGTPAYLAPELCRGGTPSEASDWYSVGATLYEALAARPPFTGSARDVVEQKCDQDAVPLAAIAPEVPADLNGICMGFLTRDPQRRLSGREALAALADSRPRLEAAELLLRPRRALFVGRHRDLESLHEALRAARDGRASCVYVHGPSGIGKTALVQQFLNQVAGREDALVLRGRCHEHESVPYKALDGVIDDVSRHLASLPRPAIGALVPANVLPLCRLFPVLLRVEAIARAPAPPEHNPDLLELRRAAISALRDLLKRMAERRPVILYIDDLHWADADSALLLQELLGPSAPAVLLLACLRDEEVAAKPFLRALLEGAGEGGGRTLAVTPLPDDESCALVASLMDPDGIGDGARPLELARAAGGNPFLLEQMASYIAVADPRPGGPAVSLGEMLDARLRALPDAARSFLDTLAVCGRPVAAATVYEAADLTGDERPLVALLRAERFLRTSGSADRVEMYHDRIGETLAARLSAEEERRIHGLMARTLAARGADDPEALFAHLRGAGHHEEAAAQAALAARKAEAALAFDQAAAFYRNALELAPGSRARCEWTEGLGDALANAGRPGDAADVFLEAAGLASDSTRRVELYRRAAEQMLVAGQIDRGLEVIHKVLREISPRRLPTTRWSALPSLALRRAQLRWRGLEFAARRRDQIAPADLIRIDTYWAVTTGLLLVSPVEAAEFHTRHLLLALDAGDPYRVARGIAVEAGLSALIGGRARRQTATLVERTRTLAEESGHPHALAMATLAAGTTEYLVGHWRNAAVLCDRALTALRDRCVGVTWELNCAQNFLIASLLYQGQYVEASRRHASLLAAARERGNLYIETELCTRMTYVWLAADDPDEAERQADGAMKRWSHRGFDRQRFGHVLGGIQIALYRGRAEQAWRLLETNWRPIERSRLQRIQSIRIEIAYVRARCALLMAAAGHDSHRFLAVARAEARSIAREQTPWGDPLADLVSATAAYLEGDAVLAEARLARAADGLDRADMQLHAAAARQRLGALLGADRGRALTDRASDWMAAQQLRNPAHMTRLIAPGWPAADGG